MLVVSSSIFLSRDFVCSLFSKDPKVIEELLRIVPVFCVFICIDCVHAVQLGVIKGLGLQEPGSRIALICNYVIGLPLSILFAFKLSLGDRGFWLGMLLAQIVNDIAFFFLTYSSDWEAISQKARITLDQDNDQEKGVEDISPTLNSIMKTEDNI